LFVCTGNICRSPTAEAVFARLVRENGLEGRVRVDSAGTHDYHPDAAPDLRTQRHALRRGYDLSALRQRVLVADDFERFDLVLVMDAKNASDAQPLCALPQRQKLRALLEFAPAAGRQDVPDPYYGAAGDFELVLDLVEQAARGLLAHVRERLAAP